MTRDQLRQVTRATGESVQTIRHRGFEIVDPDEEREELETLLTLQCPFCGRQVVLSADGPEGLPELAECNGCDLIFDYQDDDVEQVTLTQFLAQPDSVGRNLLYA